MRRYNPIIRVILIFSVLMISAALMAWTDNKVNQDTDNSIQNEPSMTINHHYTGDLLNMVVGYNDIGKSLGISYSPDSGNTWFDVQLPQKWANTGDPSLGSDNFGNVYACFLSYGNGTTFLDTSGIYVCKSTDGGRTWLSPQIVDEQAYPGSGPPVSFADKCMLAVDTNSSSPFVNSIYVGWQRDNTDGAHSDIYFARSTNLGTSFSTPIKINDNPLGTTFSEGAFPFVGSDGDVYLTWYDSYFQGHEPGSLYVDKSIDGGLTFGADIKVTNFLAPPKYTYSNTNFKAKSFPSAAADPNNSEQLYISYIGDPDGYFDKRISNGYAPGVPPSPGGDWPVVDRSGNYAYSAWRDSRNGNFDIYFNRSTDNGQSWSLPDIGPIDNGDSPGANSSSLQQLSSSGSYVYCVWEDYRNGGRNVYFNYSSNNGASWAVDKQIDGTPATNLTGGPAIASFGNDVYVAWPDLRNGFYDIYFTHSANNGFSWSTPQRIDLGDAPGATDAINPRLACIGSTVYCMWADNRIGGNYQTYFNYSTNAGALWQVSSAKISSGSGYTCIIPSRGGLECSGTFVYASWEADPTSSGMWEIHFASSGNGGVTWNADVQINDPGAFCSGASLDFAGNNVYIGWTDDRVSPGSASYDVYFDYSTNNGATWQSPDINIDHLVGIRDQVVTIKSDNNYVYATWYDGRQWGGFGGDVFFNRSTDNGATWLAETIINHGSLPVGLQNNYPVMAAGNGYVNIVWPDPRVWGIPNIYTNYSTDNGTTWLTGLDEADVYCVRSTDGGMTWQSPVTVNDDATTYAQVLPCVVVKSNSLVDVSYYNFRKTPINPQFLGAEVRLAISSTGGASFMPSFAIQDTVTTPMMNWAGEYNGMAVLDSFVYTVFTDFEQSGNSDIYIDRQVNPSISCGCGDADGSGAVDISDAVYLINYIFGGGPAPVCNADVDCSGGVDISDAVYLINYIFGGGPTPCDPNGDGLPDC